MPLYKMLCIAAHYSDYKHIKDLVHHSASHILKNGGVVRKLTSWGTLSLPQRMRRHQQYHTVGDYWTMAFDASPKLLNTLRRSMRDDPRVIRCTVLKQGERVQDIVGLKTKTTFNM